MEGLSDTTLLDVWERGDRRDPIGRALAMLGAARPDLDAGALARVDVFARDRALLGLRVATFGVRLPCIADCPRCRQRLEFELRAPALADSGAPGEAGGAGVALPSGTRFRLPNSEDLRALAASADPDEALRLIVRRCRLAPADDAAGEGADATSAEVEELDHALAAITEATELRLDLTCIACGHAWSEALDVASYLWDEIDERAERLLDDVHVLASWYGWSEGQILALGDARRRAYLERCQR